MKKKIFFEILGSDTGTMETLKMLTDYKVQPVLRISRLTPNINVFFLYNTKQENHSAYN